MPTGSGGPDDRYTLDVLTPILPPEEPAELRFRVLGPDGQPVREFRERHERLLHLIIVSTDLVVFHHVHPDLGADGTWTVGLAPLAPGPYRMFADCAVVDGPELVLAADLSVHRHRPLPPAATMTTVDGYDVGLRGELHAGTHVEVVFSVSQGGRPVADLEPYLGALGHLVVIGAADLSYLHVHPMHTAHSPGEVSFGLFVPSAGAYRLFFEFSHRGTVRAAAFTIHFTHGAEHA